MLALFIGGIKSGKSKNAEKYVLKHSKKKPIYLATTEFFDQEMKEKVQKHQDQRTDSFHTIEEPLELSKHLKMYDGELILIECISMWINNMIYHGFDEVSVMEELEKLGSQNKNIVFVINDVSSSVVSENPLVRKFVEINGRVSQYLASECKEVYNTIAGISVKIK